MQKDTHEAAIIIFQYLGKTDYESMIVLFSVI